MSELPSRKHPRLKGYDYSQNGMYFVTFCTINREYLFSDIRPVVPNIIGLLKRYTNKKFGRNLFQSSYHDHVIRDENDFLNHYQYITSNPDKWTEDEYYNASR